MSAADAVNIADLRHVAQKRLPGFLFDFIEGGVDDESGLVRNQHAFCEHMLLPRYLVDVSKRDLTTTLFGKRYAAPFGVSPTGPAALFRPGADAMLAEAAQEADVPFILSGAGSSVEDIAKVAPRHLWFQLYGARNRDISRDQIARALDCGVEVLVVTVDTPVTPKRERHLRNGIAVPFKLKGGLLPRMALEVIQHPGWFLRHLLAGGMPVMGNWAPYLPNNATPSEVAAFFYSQAFVWGEQPSQIWNDLEDYRRLWPGKLVVKGLLHPDDAMKAAALGADGVIVSNHGGKVLDRAPASLHALPSIAEAVGSRMTVMLDSGVRRGSDIVIARCLGAEFVFVGRATLYGVAAAGLNGARRAIDILRSETDLVLATIGCRSAGALGPHFLFGSTSVGGAP